MSNELKPCPFCGGSAVIDSMGTGRASMKISCEDCGASVESGDTWIDENSAWNTRAEIDSEQEQRDKLERHNESVRANSNDADYLQTR